MKKIKDRGTELELLEQRRIYLMQRIENYSDSVKGLVSQIKGWNEEVMAIDTRIRELGEREEEESTQGD